jgi:hypothetical protein
MRRRSGSIWPPDTTGQITGHSLMTTSSAAGEPTTIQYTDSLCTETLIMTTASEQYPLEPDWVMFGVQHLRGVVLLASKDLSRAQLESETTWNGDLLFALRVRPDDVRTTYKITAEMSRYVRVEAPDYPTALRRLMEVWSPDQEPLPPGAIGK